MREVDRKGHRRLHYVARAHIADAAPSTIIPRAVLDDMDQVLGAEAGPAALRPRCECVSAKGITAHRWWLEVEASACRRRRAPRQPARFRPTREVGKDVGARAESR
jgi:hypothetical protein